MAFHERSEGIGKTIAQRCFESNRNPVSLFLHHCLLYALYIETMAPLKDPPTGQSTPGGSITSEASSTGFRPVPKMRTFASRRSSTLSNNAPRRDLHGDTKAIVPAPRVSLKYASQRVVGSQSSDSSIESHAQGTRVSQVPQSSPRVVAAEHLQRPTEQLRREEPAQDLKNIPSITPETSVTNYIQLYLTITS